MQAVILAAGMGKRLKQYTKNNTKCMVHVCGETLISRMLHILDKKKLNKIVIVVGYKKETLIGYINDIPLCTPVEYVENPDYEKTNNIYSLLLAKDYLMLDDSIILESDLIFEESVIDVLLEDDRDNLALVDKYENWMDGACMVLDDNDHIQDFIKGRNIEYTNINTYYKTVNIYKFSASFSKHIYVPFLTAYMDAMGTNEYYESVIKLISMLECKGIQAKRLDNQLWYEIDDIQDLDIAESLFENAENKRYELISKRYGGFWRYPKMMDYCYLVNPYYPTDRMRFEIKNNFDILLQSYPSGQDILKLLANKHFGVGKEYLSIGNGAAELIDILMNSLEGKCGFIIPTFEEYRHRYPENESVFMNAEYPDFKYGVEDIIAFFKDKHISNFVLINPDNPSGNMICKEDIYRLIDWCVDNGIRLILDESFVDFSDYKEQSLFHDDIIKQYRDNLILVKSISKSYGVPGVRLGILASGDTKLIEKINKQLPIWNINSFAEYFLQIVDKYNDAYERSLVQLSDSRKKMFDELSHISYMRPIPSHANYIMVELLDGVMSRDLSAYLLQKNILIKDLTEKMGNHRQYIRLAIRTEDENAILCKLLNEYKNKLK